MHEDLFQKQLKLMMDRIMFEFSQYGVCLIVARNTADGQKLEFVSNMPIDMCYKMMHELSKGAEAGVVEDSKLILPN